MSSTLTPRKDSANSKSITVKEVKQLLGHTVDQVSRLHNQTIIVRKEYLYKHGVDAIKFARDISIKLRAANVSNSVVESGDFWQSNRIKSYSLTKQRSHFWAIIK